MKKSLLLSAAAVLLSASAVSAQTYKEGALYTEGEVVSSVDGITSGLYFIKVHAKSGNNDPTFSRGEKLLYNYHGAGAGNVGACLYTDYKVPVTDDPTLLWNITVTDGQFDGNDCKIFTVQSVSEGSYWSVNGRQCEDEYPAKGDMYDTTDESKIAQYHLVDLPEDYIYEGKYTDNKRFFVQLTNAQFHNGTNYVYPFFHNNAQSPVCLSYWGFSNVNSTSVQLEFVKAVENNNIVAVTVNFPKFNMDDMSTTFGLDSTSGAADLKEAIDDFIAQHGGMNDVVYPTVTEFNDGDVYTVGGTWVNQLVPNHVYRFQLRPGHSEISTAATRYLRDDVEDGVNKEDIGYILTRNGDAASFNTIELERFWYFTEVQAPTETEGGIYTIHTLARPYEKGVYVIPNSNNEKCLLLESPTQFQMMSSGNTDLKQPGDFAFVITGTQTSYLNDVGGKLGIWTDGRSRNDGGSLIRLTSLVEDDFNDFAQFAPSELVEAAKADPTPENVLALYEYYTGRELEAAIYAAKTYKIGDEVGEYNNADHNFAELLAAAEAVAANENATEAEKAAAAASISEYTLVVNMPTPGRFYRFRSTAGNKLLSSLPITVGGDYLIAHEVPEAGVETAGANTVFYLHEDEEGNLALVSFADGKVISKFNDKPWNFVLKGSANASSGVKFGHRGKNGGFIICVDQENHRHLFHADADANTIDCGNNITNGYQWEIIPVTSLPVPMFGLTEDAEDESTPSFYFSIHSPVALENIDNVEAYTGEFTGTAVEKTKIEGNIIPANTPVLLEYKGGVHHGDHGDYLFLPIVENGVSTQAAASTDIKGDIFAFQKEENTHYYTLHETSMNRFRLHKVYAEANEDVDNDVVPGFKAHIAVPKSDNPTEYFEIIDNSSTNIDEVEAEGNLKAAKVYDLQGRKLAAPAKGINIINGQKVLVK